MRYAKFDANTNISIESVTTEEIKLQAEGWYEIPEEIKYSTLLKLDNKKVRQMTDEEIKEWQKPLRLNALLTAVRNNRDYKISQSDWTELPSVVALHDKAWSESWKKYRQQLRDITTTITDPDQTVEWPVPPSA